MNKALSENAPAVEPAPTASDHGMPMQAALRRKGAQDLAKDPVCGMMVDKASALRSERGGRSFYFCSVGCQRTFDSPEQELKSMRTRVTIALTGVLALATGATIITWVPIPALPWFTWGMWLFLLVTPVQFIGGWSFYVGSWNAIRNRSINMDLLIALGTSVAYLYSVAVLFFPGVLPVKVEERDVYFEVSAVIIAFVLLGKYMEEIIKKHSSAAVRKLLDLKPATAQVVREGVEMEVPAESVMVGVGRGAQAGILIRGGEILEKAQKLDTVVFDKTGTLTRGEPNITDVLAQSGWSKEQTLLKRTKLD